LAKNHDNPELDFDTITEMINVGILLNRYVDKESARVGFNRDYGRILLGLVSNGPMTQTEISEMMLYSNQRVTLTINKMEGEGLLKRAVSTDDRRKNKITITEKGLALIHKSVPKVPEVFIRAMPPNLKTAQKHQLYAILDELRDHLLKQNGMKEEQKILQRLKLRDLENLQ
jgi:DNA-binding MarR family transcriptional regulator